jgi:hypothetical protein
MISLSPAMALAGQASASFQVGIIIGGGNHSARPAQPTKTYTWGAAVISLNRAGFDAAQRVEKSDTLYWFTAKRDGYSFRVAVSITSGKVMRVLPV